VARIACDVCVCVCVCLCVWRCVCVCVCVCVSVCVSSVPRLECLLADPYVLVHINTHKSVFGLHRESTSHLHRLKHSLFGMSADSRTGEHNMVGRDRERKRVREAT